MGKYNLHDQYLPNIVNDYYPTIILFPSILSFVSSTGLICFLYYFILFKINANGFKWNRNSETTK